jgi:acid phosphatase
MRAILVIASVVLVGAQPHENLNAVLWMQTAAEYQAAARQAYRAAEIGLERALKDPAWTAALEQAHDSTGNYDQLPPAVILDLDETVLDNSAYQARLTARGGTFSDESWQKWVAETKSAIVPGAREFLSFAHARGVRVYYVTNRVCDSSTPADPTVRVLRIHSLPFGPGQLLCKNETSDKSPRRKQVAQMARIMIVIGDDLNDFVSTAASVAARAELVRDFGRYWGERWFMIPNPSYGSWERVVGTTVEAKRKALRQ